MEGVKPNLVVNILRNRNCPMVSERSFVGGFDRNGYDLNISNAKTFSLTRGVGLDGITNSIGIFLISPLQRFFAHIAPKPEMLDKTLDGLELAVNDMRRTLKQSKDGDVVALVAGGADRYSEDKFAQDSAIMSEAILDTLSDCDVEVNAITDNLSTGVNNHFNMYSLGKTVTLWDGIMLNVKKTLNPSKEETKEAINSLQLKKNGNDLSREEMLSLLKKQFGNVQIQESTEINIVDELPPVVPSRFQPKIKPKS